MVFSVSRAALVHKARYNFVDIISTRQGQLKNESVGEPHEIQKVILLYFRKTNVAIHKKTSDVVC